MVDDLVTAAGGSISAEHGIGQLKRDEFERLAPPGRIAALRAIKQALDPLGIMNPGKLVPLALVVRQRPQHARTTSRAALRPISSPASLEKR